MGECCDHAEKFMTYKHGFLKRARGMFSANAASIVSSAAARFNFLRCDLFSLSLTTI